MFYRGKHYKKDPRVERIKGIPKWIKGECIFYLKWWVSLKDRIPKHGAKMIDYHDAFWDMIEDNTIKFFKKVRYNVTNLKN
jgi:hypothetical protein